MVENNIPSNDFHSREPEPEEVEALRTHQPELFSHPERHDNEVFIGFTNKYSKYSGWKTLRRGELTLDTNSGEPLPGEPLPRPEFVTIKEWFKSRAV